MGHVENLRNVDAGSEQEAGCALLANPPPSQLHPYPCPEREPWTTAKAWITVTQPQISVQAQRHHTENLTERQTLPASVFLSPGARAGPSKLLVLGCPSCSREGWM